MYFYKSENRAPINMMPGVTGRSFWGKDVMLVVVDLDAGAIVPSHSHPHEQAGIVMKGEIEFTIGVETKILSPGEIYMIPGGVEHSVKVGDEPVQVLDVFTPIRKDLQY